MEQNKKTDYVCDDIPVEIPERLRTMSDDDLKSEFLRVFGVPFESYLKDAGEI